MKSQQFDIEKKMLWGDSLRVLLNSDHITYGEIHELLKLKGIFVNSTEKSIIVPLLCSTLLNPEELSLLIDKSFTRESSVKKNTASIKLSAPEVDWRNTIIEHFEQNIEFPLEHNIEFEQEPTLTALADGGLDISYTIKREDFSRDWIEQEILFDGKIHISQEDGELRLNFNKNHTSKETDRLNKAIISSAAKACKAKGLTLDEEANSIKFENFTNEERVLFFLKLTNSFDKLIKLGKVLDIEIIRDMTAGPLPKDPEISWMENTVRRMKIDGEKLNSLFLLKKNHYHKFFYIMRMNVEYEFSFGTSTGHMTVSYAFTGRNHKLHDDFKGTEFSYIIEKISNIEKTAESSVKQKIDKTLGKMQDASLEQIVSSRPKPQV